MAGIMPESIPLVIIGQTDSFWSNYERESLWKAGTKVLGLTACASRSHYFGLILQ